MSGKRKMLELTSCELELAAYLLDRISKTLVLDEDGIDRVYRDNSDFICMFPASMMDDFEALKEKLTPGETH